MAIAGGATTAYFCSIEDGKLMVHRTTCLRSYCDDPQGAIELLCSGLKATVAGSDMVEVRALWSKQERSQSQGINV